MYSPESSHITVKNCIIHDCRYGKAEEEIEGVVQKDHFSVLF